MVGGGLLQPNSSFSLCQGQRVNARLRVLFFMRRVTGEFCSLRTLTTHLFQLRARESEAGIRR